jgi:predicted AAA+ superfamily ATPase
MPRLADIRHDPAVIRRLIASLARSVATEVTYTTLAADVQTVAPGITAETVSAYVNGSTLRLDDGTVTCPLSALTP